MKTIRLIFLGAFGFALLALCFEPAHAAEPSWVFGPAQASKAPAPTVTEYRERLPDLAVKEVRTKKMCFCEDGEPCQCGPDCECIRLSNKAKSKEVKKDAKVSWDWSNSTSKAAIKDDPFADSNARWQDAVVQAPLRWTQGGVAYDVPVFSGGVMYGTPVSDLSLLGPPPPDIVGVPVVTTIPYQPRAAYAPAYQPAYAVPTYQSYYSPPQQNTSYSYRQSGLFGQRRSYDVQQSYSPPTVGYRQTGAMICGPSGCAPGN